MADVNTTVNSDVAVAEDVDLAVDQTPTGYTAEVISLAEYAEVTVKGEGDVSVEDENWTQETLIAAATYTNAMVPRITERSLGFLNISISLTGTLTVTLQRSFDAGLTWKDYADYTASVETYMEDKEKGVFYRLGIKTGNYTSGSAICRLGIGG